MSHIADKPVAIPAGVELTLQENSCRAKGGKGEMTMPLHADVRVERKGDILQVVRVGEDHFSHAMAGTTRALLANLITGVSEGFRRELEVHGVGYRAQAKGKALELSLGYSHPVLYQPPEGVVISAPSQTQIVVEGVDKQRVGQVAAEIRGLRPAEPYGGKGVRYSGEQILRKEVKKK